MEKIDIEKESVVLESDILDIEDKIEKCKNNRNFINDNSTPLSIQKQTISNLIENSFLNLKRDKYKTIFNFQKKDDHGFFSLKSANEELQKIVNSISLIEQLSFLIDLSYYNYNSINYNIIFDMKSFNSYIECIKKEIPNDKYYGFIVNLLKDLNKKFESEYLKIINNLKNKIINNSSEITLLNQELMTKHIISKNLFDIIKEYLELIKDGKVFDDSNLKIVDEIKNEYSNSDNNEYLIKIKKLESIKNNYNNIDDKYKKAIKKFDYQVSFDILEKLKVISITKEYIKFILLNQKRILNSLIKKEIFKKYLDSLENLIIEIDECILELEKELNNSKVSEYIELFDLINLLVTYNLEIKSYEEKISKSFDNTEIISYNNKITALSIKKRRVDISLLKNRYFDSSKIDKNIDIDNKNNNSFYITSNINDEINDCYNELNDCYKKIDDKLQITNMWTEYNDNNVSDTLDYPEYLIVNNKYILAKLYTLKIKLLDLVYSKYVQSDMENDFKDYLLSNTSLSIEDIILDYEILEFEKSKIKEKDI